ERRGPESQKGQNDTYFVYNALGQLRFVLSPAYQQDADLTEYAYEYRYDQHGNVVYKSIPGAGYTQYWYDRAGRLAYMQDANLRSKSLYRFFVYDKAGRQAIQGVCKVCTRDETVNFATYAGGTSGFMQTGYTLANASRIQQATLETVSYYDGYTFASALDSDLVKATTQSVKGLLTGSVVYNSDGTKSTSAFYYDAKGQVTESREKTSFGTLRTTTNTYTYSGQPLKTSMTEGSVTLITENTYDSATGLLTATDVTVNGVKRRVSAVTYDDLGRIASVVRGAEQNSGGKVSYTYNLHGQTRSISGPGFSQNLYYADWTGTKLYNGSVSAMTWIMGTDATVRGYKYIYNGYGWLASADYGEGDALTSNRMHYTEKATSFTLNGGVKKLERYGRMSSGTFGKIDDLTVSYSGNRISTVSDAAPAVTQTGSMDYPGGSYLSAFTYSDFGALTSDRSRGISSIIYDNLGNPLKTSFSNGNITHNVYSATGEKLRSDAVQSISGTSISRTITDYRGPVVYRDGKVHMVLFPGGYATINGTAVIFHYYTQDYLGNNRAVINGSTGAIEQTVAYYPYGAVIADLGTNPTTQQYKFGGKELITANGLNEYDFGARNYYPAVPAFTRIDQQCENFQHLSPYLFCGNDPVNNVDPTGKVFETVWDIGNVLYDVGAAIYHHATGDHEAATGNWVDAGLDVVAVIIPGLPAGTSKLLSTGAKTAKNIEKASDVNKGIEIASEIGKTGIEKTAESSRNAAIRAGRSGKQGRLRELGDDPKLGKNDRAWIKQDQKLIKENKRTSIRVPPGKELAHPRGKEAAKGYTYKEAKLQLKSNHKIQHKHDNNGKKNR
ncbi:MAG: hypothetical protein K2H72_06000, partial [Muribaculaceae bacterium]|nr:hypothetical protein [Muribaculaceae bacterium]